MELKPKSVLGNLEISAYKKDVDDFHKILDHLNKLNKDEGDYTSEDLFRFLISAGIDKMPELGKALSSKKSRKSQAK